MGHDKNIKSEKAHLNLARLRSGKGVFEINIDPDKAIDYRHGKIADIREVLKSESIFSDARNGLHAPEGSFKQVFGTEDKLEIAKRIIQKGEIQFTEEYRDSLKQQKKRQILDYVHRNAVNPKNGFPHPLSLLETAYDDLKIKIDYTKPVNQLVNEVIAGMKLQLPLKIELKDIELHIPSTFAHQSYAAVQRFGKILKDEWLHDNSRMITVEISGGMEQDLYDKLNSLTHGGITAKVVKTRG